MIYLIGSQKGGCGKSTIAVNVSAELAQRGKDVVLVDSDRQGTAGNWATDRVQVTTLPKVNCVQRFDNIRETLLDLNNRYEYVVVDAAGRDSRELRTGMTAADVLLVPFRPSQPDLDTLPTLVDIINQAKDLNDRLVSKAILTMAPTNPQVNETRESTEYLENFPELELIASVICDRKVYRDAMSEGRGVVEMNNEKASAEIKQLIEEVFYG